MPQGEPIVVFTRPSLGGGGPPAVFSVQLTRLFASPQEIGTALVNPQFNVTYNPPATEVTSVLSNTFNGFTQNLIGLPNPIVYGTTIGPGGSASTIGGTVTFTVNASDGVNNASSQQSVQFLPRVYFGVNANPALASEAEIEGLAVGPSGQDPLQSSRAGAFMFSAVNQYVYYAFPSAYGPAGPLNFQIGPFPGGFTFLGTVILTANTTGAPSNSYDIWRSTFTQDTTIPGPQTLLVS